MSWFKRDSPFRSSLRGKFRSIVSSASSASPPPVEHDARACFESFKMHWQQAWEVMRPQLTPATANAATANTPVGGHQQASGPSQFPTPHLPITQDQISSVLNHLDQMLLLLLHDIRSSEASIGPILDVVLTEDILAKLLAWSLRAADFVAVLKLEQLKLYEMLITQSHQEVLVHKPILIPLLKLLSTCEGCSPVEVEKRLVILLNQLCFSLTTNATLLEFFFSAGCDQGSAKFLIFSLLIPFVHREGALGQQARDALLLCMSLSRKIDSIGIYIAENSTFCPVLATGLSGLYSLLPRKLTFELEDWHQLTADDINEIPELAMFLNSLEFCNAVIQIAHPLVQEQLLEYLTQGFLLPVLVPALQVPTEEASLREVATATAYLDLFLRKITEASLMQAFLKMLLLKSPHSEGQPVIENIILRISSQSPLCVVTLSLFRTLLDLNCEDVMLELVFKFLIPCTHVMVSQRCRVRDVDMFGKSAEKFLALLPTCCLPPIQDMIDDQVTSLEVYPDHHQQHHPHHYGPASLPTAPTRLSARRHRTPSASSFSPGDILELVGGGGGGGGSNHFGGSSAGVAGYLSTQVTASSFLDYLMDARQTVTACMVACECWAWPYDGEQPPPTAPPEQLPPTPVSATASSISGNALSAHHTATNNNQSFSAIHTATSGGGNIAANGTAEEAGAAESPRLRGASVEMPHRGSLQSNVRTAPSSSLHDNRSRSVDDFVVVGQNGMATNTRGGGGGDNVGVRKSASEEATSRAGSQVSSGLDDRDVAAALRKLIEAEPPSARRNWVAAADGGSASSSAVLRGSGARSASVPAQTSSKFSSTSSSSSHHSSQRLSDSRRDAGKMKLPNLQSLYGSSSHSDHFGSPDLGPFLSILLSKLENMMENSVYENLQLTGVITRLASYPQPLLRSFLLNHTLVFQPSVKSLMQVLGTLKQRLDSFFYTVDNIDDLMIRARRYLAYRDERFFLSNGTVKTASMLDRRYSNPDGIARGENRRLSLTDRIFRRTPLTSEREKYLRSQHLDGIPKETGYRYSKTSSPKFPDGKIESLCSKNAVLCIVILEEFLKELSAIAMEHAVVWENTGKINFADY